MADYHTDVSRHRYPGLARAALEMAYDNGGVTRERPEAVTLNELDRVLSGPFDLAFSLDDIDRWLAGLSDEQLSVAVAGEHDEVVEMMATAHPGTDELLNAIFDGPSTGGDQ